MTEQLRVGIASRVFVLAAALSLALTINSGAALETTLIVATVAATASYLVAATQLPSHWVLACEGAFAAYVVLLGLPGSVLVLPYLVVLALLAGLDRGLRGALLVITAQLVAAASSTFLAASSDDVSTRLEVLAPWTLTIAGAGLLSSWMHKVSNSARDGATAEDFRAARRLRGQLGSFTDRFISLLEPREVAARILSAAALAPNAQAAVFVRTPSGKFTSLVHQGLEASELNAGDPLLAKCWTSGTPLRRDTGNRITEVLPLKADGEMVGVLLIDEPPGNAVPRLPVQAHKLSVSLGTALVFDEVRSLLTADERQRVAREIHDGVAQDIASLGYAVDELAADAKNTAVTAALQDLRNKLSRIVTELRLSIFDLRTDAPAGTGLGAALGDYLRTVGAQSAVRVHLTLDESRARLTPWVETELFRIAQEAITNARKHSRARNVWVECIVRPPYARISIRDDGGGMGLPRLDSYGLKIMQERADRIQAELAFRSAEGEHSSGTAVTVTIGGAEATAQTTGGFRAVDRSSTDR